MSVWGQMLPQMPLNFEQHLTILSMEFLAAMRAHGLNSGLMSPIIKDLRDAFMDAVQPASGDGILAVDMEATKQFIQSIDIEDRLAFNA